MSRSTALTGGIGAIEAAVAGDALVHADSSSDEFERLGQRDDRLFLAEVVGLRRRLHLLELGLLLRIGGERVFVGLVGAGPESGAQGDGIVVEGGELESAVAAAAGAVGLVVADADGDARDARVAVL